MSAPPPGSGPPPGLAPVTVSASEMAKTTASQQLGVPKPIVGTALLGGATLVGNVATMPRPILSAPPLGTQLKVIQAPPPTQGHSQVQLQALAAPQDQPVDLAAPKNKPIIQATSHATAQPIIASGAALAAPIAIASSSLVKSGAPLSSSATPIQTLRIPTIPTISGIRPGSPQVIAAPQVVQGTRGGASIPRAPGHPALAVAMPKVAQGAIPNLAVVHQVAGQAGSGNKVTVLQQGVANIASRGGKQTFPTGATLGGTGATTIIRPQTGTPYPVTIRAPMQAGPGQTTQGTAATAIRLTGPGSASSIGGQPSVFQEQKVHLLPVSIGTTVPSGGSTRHASGGSSSLGSSNLPTVSFRPGQATIVSAPRQAVVTATTVAGQTSAAADSTGTVRVTLVPTPIGGSVTGGKTMVSQPSSQSSTAGVGLNSPQHIYKPVTITTHPSAAGSGSIVGGIRTSISAAALVPTPISVGLTTSSPMTSTQPVRIGPIASAARTFCTTVGSASQPLTVSLTPATIGPHINVPLAPLQATSKPLRVPVGTAVSAAGKLIVAAASNNQPPPSGVTIQKTTITANTIPRTISLPYGTTQVSTINKPSVPVGAMTGQAIPVARVCPQPLNIPSACITSSTGQASNLVTITSSSISDNTNSGALEGNAPTSGSIYIARQPTSAQQPAAINLSSTGAGGGAKIIAQPGRGTTTAAVPFTYAEQHRQPSGAVMTSTAQLIASAASALASSAQIQQQISSVGTAITTISGAKISLPTQPARFVALPTQPAALVSH